MDLFKDVLPMLDKGLWQEIQNLTEEDFKKNSPFVAMKFMSACKDKSLAPYYTLAVNEVVNKGFWELSDYKDLQMMLLSLCGTGKKQYHYFPGKGVGGNKVFEFVRKCYPTWKEDEIELFLSLSDNDSLIQLAKDFGYQDKELNELKKEIKK